MLWRQLGSRDFEGLKNWTLKKNPTSTCTSWWVEWCNKHHVVVHGHPKCSPNPRYLTKRAGLTETGEESLSHPLFKFLIFFNFLCVVWVLFNFIVGDEAHDINPGFYWGMGLPNRMLPHVMYVALVRWRSPIPSWDPKQIESSKPDFVNQNNILNTQPVLNMSWVQSIPKHVIVHITYLI